MSNKKALELQALRSCIDKFKDSQLNNNNYNDNKIELSILYTTDNKKPPFVLFKIEFFVKSNKISNSSKSS